MSRPAPVLTPLQQRLEYAARHPERPWLILVENVPEWPEPPLVASPVGPDSSSAWSYPSSWGEPALIEAICQREARAGRLTCAEENVLVTNGALHAIALLLRQLRDNGVEELVCQAPVLGSVADLAVASGMVLRLLDSDELCSGEAVPVVASAVRDRRMALYLNSPHNPTGAVLPRASLSGIVELAEQTGFHIVLDAVYDDFDFAPVAGAGPTLPISNRLSVVNSFSKNYGAPGLRVGWLVTGPDLVASLVARLERECVGVARPSQDRALRLLEAGNDSLLTAVRTGRDQAQRWWSRVTGGAELRVDGGTQAWLPVDSGEDEEKLVHRFAEDHDLLIVSSSSFVGDERLHLRVPLGVPADRLGRMLQRLDRALGLGVG